MKEYAVITVGLLNIGEAHELLNQAAALGFRVINVTEVKGAVVWTMERDK